MNVSIEDLGETVNFQRLSEHLLFSDAIDIKFLCASFLFVILLVMLVKGCLPLFEPG